MLKKDLQQERNKLMFLAMGCKTHPAYRQHRAPRPLKKHNGPSNHDIICGHCLTLWILAGEVLGR